MTSNEKWNKLVNHVINFKKSPLASSEKAYQNLWFDMFHEIFDYSKLDNEICTEKPIKIGSTNHYVDIVLKNGPTELLIVEMKQCLFNLNADFEKQLISYLNQNKNSIGILICDRIYLYSYDYTKADNEQLKIEIKFEEDNKYGIQFVELFDKENFDKEKVKDFITKSNASNVNINKIRKELTPELLSHLAEAYFSEKYSEDEIKTVLQGCEIEIKPTFTTTVMPQNTHKYIATSPAKNITDDEAFEICYKNGFIFPKHNATFASLSGAYNHYPANPNFAKLKNDWYIVLNDFKNRKLHVFYIQANSIKRDELKPRRDNPSKIDLRIRYNDLNFTDVPTGYQFEQYRKKTILY